ncbi:phosphatase PAP2 family protein [Micromonospora sp. WMMD882]|uniref:phosphatase PAP2 family protein n=1 Tax=Micromonospora sp. WMMD882 TaxID=3015151 RepID=UPI00248AA1CE|nr:phosphatase PAP2 family protein [Micromonospora sp. WMMD882]WBB79798.1 phosphatase PAP2 family protein [Micromonospora sp. WMMD882]
MIARPPLSVPLSALAGLVLLTILVVAGWPPLDRADHAVSETFRAYGDRAPALVAALRILTDVAATVPFLLAGLTAAIALAARGRRPAAVCCATVTVVVPALWGLGHWLLRHPRPLDGFVTVHSNGFPSGHTSNAVAAALTVVLLLWPRLTRTGRTVVALGAVGFALFVSLTRVALLAHWPADVLGGWLLALTVVPLAARLGTRVVRDSAATASATRSD